MLQGCRSALRSRGRNPKPVSLRCSLCPNSLSLHLHLCELLAHPVRGCHAGVVPAVECHALGCGERDQQFTGHEGRLLFLLLVELPLVVLAEDHAVEGMLQQVMAKLVRDV
jgi:hypothetical protein